MNAHASKLAVEGPPGPPFRRATWGVHRDAALLLLAWLTAYGCDWVLRPDVGTEWVRQGPVEVAILCRSREIAPVDDYWMTVTVRHPQDLVVDWSRAVLDHENVVVDRVDVGEPVATGTTSSRTITYWLHGGSRGDTRIGPLSVPYTDGAGVAGTVISDSCDPGVRG